MIIERISESKRILGADTITSQDITHLSSLISDMSHKNNYEILKILPVYWTLDDSKIEKNPEGLQAKKITLTADIFYIPKMFYQSITELFGSLGVHIIDIVPNILAGAECLIDMDHKDLGTMLIDIGANQTSYVVYEE
jgi:cell division protein FtsA